MCGIAGFNWEDEHKLTALTSLLEHRGPERQGIHVGGGVSLGHKRLCILDLSERGNQPLYNEDRTVCVIYNGEIYNFKQLRQRLQAKGHIFVSNTDTEVIVHGYEEWGTEVLSELNGQFAFCVFDSNKDQLFLARDRLGIKPLYYYDSGGRFVFGSELKVFLKGDIEKKIDRAVLDHYMVLGNCPSSESILTGVKKMLPGWYLLYDLKRNQRCRYEPYWELSFPENTNADYSELKDQVREKVEQSIIKRLISDVPLGAFLSGGIDSSIIVAVMSRYVDELETFSIRFDYPDFNESEYAGLISDKFGTHHFEISFGAEDVKELIPRLAYNYDEPFGDPSMIPTCLVSSVAKKHVTVSLSGTGGDELFGGYNRYNEFSVLRILNRMPGALRYTLRSLINLANVFLKKDKLNKLQSFLCRKEPDHVIYFKLLSYMFRNQNEQTDKFGGLDYLNDYFKYPDNLKNLLNCDLQNYIPDCLLTKEDRASMSVSLETRVPFLDHELVVFAAGIPSAYKIRNGVKKYILKKAFEDVLPKEILRRKKMGFGVPLVHYFRRQLKDFAYGEIFDFDGYDYYDKTWLKGLWDRHQKGKADYSRIFWSIIMFNSWYSRWIA